MKEEKLNEILNEVLEEIEQALKDVRGLVSHQRRLAFSLSLGSIVLLELYLHKLGVIKAGSKINHLWFKRKKESIFEQLQNQVSVPVESIKNIENIVDIVVRIEEKRDELAYGASSFNELLQEKINLFFELKRIVE